MTPIRPDNDIQSRPRRAFAWGVFFALVPAGGLLVAALVAGIITAGVST